jgi:hypothetical protein
MLTRSSFLGCAALAALLAAAGGACSSDAGIRDGQGGGGSGGGGGGGAGGNGIACGDSNQAIDPTALIDDMEASDPAIAMIGGRIGSWWAGGDPNSPAGSITPNGLAASEPIPGGRCGSMQAVRITGQGFAEWAVLTTTMRWDSVDGGATAAQPYNAQGRSGVRFWARVGDTSTDQIRFSISDKYSRPEGGLCVENGPIGETCYDTHGTPLTGLGTSWRQFQIPFSGLTQRQFGLPRPEGLDTSAIYTIDFNFPMESVFDFWLDDISFY